MQVCCESFAISCLHSPVLFLHSICSLFLLSFYFFFVTCIIVVASSCRYFPSWHRLGFYVAPGSVPSFAAVSQQIGEDRRVVKLKDAMSLLLVATSCSSCCSSLVLTVSFSCHLLLALFMALRPPCRSPLLFLYTPGINLVSWWRQGLSHGWNHQMEVT